MVDLLQIHVAEYLLGRGANFALVDHEGLTAFDLALLDKQTTLDLNPKSSPSDVYAWGANANYNLGLRDVNQCRPKGDLCLKNFGIVFRPLGRATAAFICDELKTS